MQLPSHHAGLQVGQMNSQKKVKIPDPGPQCNMSIVRCAVVRLAETAHACVPHARGGHERSRVMRVRPKSSVFGPVRKVFVSVLQR